MCKKFPTYQRSKKTNHKYGKLPPKQAQTNPWDMLCVDLIVPYMIPQKRTKSLKLWCLTMIDPVTSWFDMAQIPNKMAAKIADISEKTWFTCYPLPQPIVFYHSTEFMAEFAKMCQNEYGLKGKPITTRDPQSNTTIERIHQTIGNIIRTFDMSNIVIKDPWSGILAATMFSVRATYHTTLQVSPMQLVFGRETILNIKNVADWKHIRQHKQERIIHNNKRENMCRNNHQYKVGHKILVKHKKNSKYELKFMGPSLITQIIKCLRIRDYIKT